uniref:Uncharacterized protein n=1 Tax=Arundo donax TaxID=35708 RepID=A0A0A9A5H3_ARUDO
MLRTVGIGRNHGREQVHYHLIQAVAVIHHLVVIVRCRRHILSSGHHLLGTVFDARKCLHHGCILIATRRLNHGRNLTATKCLHLCRIFTATNNLHRSCNLSTTKRLHLGRRHTATNQLLHGP